MATELLYPSVRPSLDLNFARSKSVDPRITFARASGATYYDGRTVAKAEENLLLRSQEFDQSPWEKLLAGAAAAAPVVTANAGTAPDGTVTADRVVFSLNGGVSVGDISQLVQTVTLSGQYVFSIWLKAADGLSTYNMQLAGAGAVADIAVNGSWQRFTVTGTYSGAYSNQLRLRGAQGVVNSNTADVLVWGAQLEQRSQVTAYTPTTTQPITNYIPVLQTAPDNVPRIDHDPVTGECKGLLIEELRQNLLTYSEQLDLWGKASLSVSADVSIAPNGSLSAEKLTEDASNNFHLVSRGGFTPVAGQTYTVSFFAKAAGRTLVYSRGSGGLGELGASFNLAAAQVNNTTSGVTASITPVGNDWYRCSYTLVATSAGSSVLYIFPAASPATSAGNNPVYQGDGYSGIYVWGAQLEAGSFPTSYIKTVAEQATRAADSAQMTGANFSSWYRQDEGTLVADFKVHSSVPGTVVAAIDNGLANGFTLYKGATSLSMTGYKGVYTVPLGAVDIAKFNLVAITQSRDNLSGSLNSSSVTTQAAPAYPVASQMKIGNSWTPLPMSGHIKRLTFYPKALPTYLQALTT